MLVPHLSDNVGQPRVAQQEPAPWCDPICLVLKLLRFQLIEILEPGTAGSRGRTEPLPTPKSFSCSPACAAGSGQCLLITIPPFLPQRKGFPQLLRALSALKGDELYLIRTLTRCPAHHTTKAGLNTNLPQPEPHTCRQSSASGKGRSVGAPQLTLYSSRCQSGCGPHH